MALTTSFDVHTINAICNNNSTACVQMSVSYRDNFSPDDTIGTTEIVCSTISSAGNASNYCLLQLVWYRDCEWETEFLSYFSWRP